MVRIDRYVRQYVSKLLVDAELNKVKMANQRQLKGDKLLKVRLNMHFYHVIIVYIRLLSMKWVDCKIDSSDSSHTSVGWGGSRVHCRGDDDAVVDRDARWLAAFSANDSDRQGHSAVGKGQEVAAATDGLLVPSGVDETSLHFQKLLSVAL